MREIILEVWAIRNFYSMTKSQLTKNLYSTITDAKKDGWDAHDLKKVRLTIEELPQT